MESERIDIQAVADEIVSSYCDRQIQTDADELRQIMSGEKKANRDTKRILCTDINYWVDFLSPVGTEDAHIHVRKNRSGKIETYIPKNEVTEPLYSDPEGELRSF